MTIGSCLAGKVEGDFAMPSDDEDRQGCASHASGSMEIALEYVARTDADGTM